MKKTMLAAIFRGPREFEVTHIPVPEVGPDDVLLRVLACGICGSELFLCRVKEILEHVNEFFDAEIKL